MKKIATTLLLLAGIIFQSLQAQDQDILVTIGDDNITAGEFIRAYSKNNNWATASEAELRDYLELFINFKMKVKQGVEMQLDTSRKFQMELMSYQKQSAQQFLIDKEVTDALLNEACERARWNIRAAHILINCQDGAAPKDTAAAYSKALSIREEILNGAISFADAAVKYSEDPSARDMVNPQTQRLHPGNQGDLGYFTVFDLIYPFESAAYQTPVGKVSMPVRTRFGYHLILVKDRIPALEDIQIAQIYIADSLAKENQQLPSTQKKLQDALALLKSGANFSDAVEQFSEENDAAKNGGVQEPFSPNSRKGDFIKAIISLKENEVSEPIATQNGWHIVKLLKTTPVVVDDNMIYGIKNRITRDSRSHKSKESFIAKLKKEYKYDESGRKKAIKLLLKNMPAEYFQTKDSELHKAPGIEKLQPMATFANVEITAVEFAKFIGRFRGVRIDTKDFEKFLQEKFDSYVATKINQYENDHLMEKHADLRELVAEFHDGMVLFEVNTLKVWGQAVQDSTGIENFYNENKQNYIDEETQQPKPLQEIRANVITDYQEHLDKQWIEELRLKYHPVIREDVFARISKK